VIVVRYADDSIVGFEHRHEAEQFLADLKERLARFGLNLHPEKTRLIEFRVEWADLSPGHGAMTLIPQLYPQSVSDCGRPGDTCFSGWSRLEAPPLIAVNLAPLAPSFGPHHLSAADSSEGSVGRWPTSRR
jgi:hypothetical protein